MRTQSDFTWDDEHVAVLLAVVGPMSTGAVSDGEARRLLADLLQHNILGNISFN